MENYLDKVQHWLNGPYDEETKTQILYLQNNKPEELKEAFSEELEFGTGGLRGIMGVGPNRMNKYTVGAATQGLANFLKKQYPNQSIAVAISYDSRNNSKFFAELAASILSANGIKVFMFNELRPTPELSFTVRYFYCKAGIMITASHNPPEYNGYKVYGEDGGQVVSPYDQMIINEVRAITSPDQINFTPDSSLIHILDNNFDTFYIQAIRKSILQPDVIKKKSDLSIVYTPLHGTGYRLMEEALKDIGFTNVFVVPEQAVIDGNFPTVKYPNPEDPEAMQLAIEYAKQRNADLVIASDPDADRLGVGIKTSDGNYLLLNGNQIATILLYYTLSTKKSKNELPPHGMIIKTIVTTELIREIAKDFNVKMYDVLTGFKYIAEIIRKKEGEELFLGGCEESYGYLGNDMIRDKDGIMAGCMIAEVAAYCALQNKTLLDYLNDIYEKYGFYMEEQVSLTKKGLQGKEEIKAMMEKLRQNPPQTIASKQVIKIKDFLTREEVDLPSKNIQTISLPKSNVLQYFLDDESKITVRPSGTEPKIKFYFEVKIHPFSTEAKTLAHQKINVLKEFFLEL
ncbi:MAG: phospho-sugar mutase [Bacteroidales bacterium]|nr:phospho-sugar mutase [Bacteroidales bacterium]